MFETKAHQLLSKVIYSTNEEPINQELVDQLNNIQEEIPVQENYYMVYCTINLINFKFYIGMHQTKNLNDKYIGSGT